MRKILFIVIILAGIYAFYEQSKPVPNVWISAFCIGFFMVGLLVLNRKVSDNSFSGSDKEKTEENDK